MLLGQHLSTWPDNVKTGTVSLLRGQNFALQKHLISKGNPAYVQFHDSSDNSVAWLLNANDISGLVDIPAGCKIFNGDILAKVLFSDSYYAPPKVVITAANAYTSRIHTYVESNQKGFSIKTNEKADRARHRMIKHLFF